MTARLRPGPIVPAPVVALRIGNQPQSTIQHRADPRVVGHAMGLAEHKSRQTVVVHISLRIGDVQQPRGFSAPQHVIECLVDHLAILADAGRVAVGQEGQSPHAHQPQVV